MTKQYARNRLQHKKVYRNGTHGHKTSQTEGRRLQLYVYKCKQSYFILNVYHSGYDNLNG